MNNPNSFDEETQDANANPDTNLEGTEQTDTVQTPAAEVIDYEKKFRESAKEAQRLYEENKALREFENAQTSAKSETLNTPPEAVEALFPGFEDLDEDAQANLIAYSRTITDKAKRDILKDPAIAFSRQAYNEHKWNEGFTEATQALPELAEHKDKFRARYYNVNNVPDNIKDILVDLGKGFLYDKAKEIGADEERKRSSRIDLENITGGDKQPQQLRSLADWTRMSQENPTKFASMSKEFNEDLKKGIN
jgi:hypothetical protein